MALMMLSVVLHFHVLLVAQTSDDFSQTWSHSKRRCPKVGALSTRLSEIYCTMDPCRPLARAPHRILGFAVWTRGKSFTLLLPRHWAKVSGGCVWLHCGRQNTHPLGKRNLVQRFVVLTSRLTLMVFLFCDPRFRWPRRHVRVVPCLGTGDRVFFCAHGFPRRATSLLIPGESGIATWFLGRNILPCFSRGLAVMGFFSFYGYESFFCTSRGVFAGYVYYGRWLRFFIVCILTLIAKFSRAPNGLATERRCFTWCLIRFADMCEH